MPAGKEIRLESQDCGENLSMMPMPTEDATGAGDAAEGHVDAEGRTPANSRPYIVEPTTIADEFADGFNRYNRPRGGPA